MPNRSLSHFLVACVLAVSLSVAALAQNDGKKEISTRKFVADTEAIEPGKPFFVGFHFKVIDGWHLYWRFPGGPGEPFRVAKWDLPPGWQVEDIEYPLPVLEDDGRGTVFYAYEHEVFFRAKITPPKKIAGKEVKIGAKVTWQACADICVPGNDSLEMNLPVGAPTPANAELFKTWAQRMPLTTEPPTKDVKFDFVGKKLTVRVGGIPADTKTEFFAIPPLKYGGPLGRFGAPFDSTQKLTAETSPDGVRVFTYPFDEELTWSGLLVTTGADGVRRGWYIGEPPAVESETLGAKFAAVAEDDGDGWDPFDDIEKGEKGRNQGTSLFSWIIRGFLGGLLLNLMPCVLPVISLKIFGFVRQAGESRDRVFKLGLAFCAGVFGFFLVLALLVLGLASANQSLGWGAQFSNPVALTVMVAVMFLFGLSLLGVFEITLGGAESKLSEASSKEGAGGAFMHGFFTTLLGTSCTAPLVGPVIGAAVNEPGSRIFALFGAVATGLSLPYFLLTWQPAWMKFLPKPGMWMVRFKQILGFVMVGFAVWLLNALPSAAMVVTVAGFLLTLGFAAWLLGTFHGAKWALPVVLALAVGGWFVFVRGKVERPPVVSSGLVSAVRNGLNEGRPVFVDFTADWCLNCKFFENTVLHTQPVQDAFKAKKIVFVKADYTAAPPDISAALKKTGRAGVPLYVLFRKRGDYWISESLSQAGLLEELNKL